MISFDNLMLRALQVLNARLKKENTATRIGSLFRDILLYFNNMIQNAILGIIIKGEKANEAEIKAIADPAKGDTWKALDTGHYWTYDGAEWNDIGVIIPDNVMMSGGTDKTGQQLDNQFSGVFSLVANTGAPFTDDQVTTLKVIKDIRIFNGDINTKYAIQILAINVSGQYYMRLTELKDSGNVINTVYINHDKNITCHIRERYISVNIIISFFRLLNII